MGDAACSLSSRWRLVVLLGSGRPRDQSSGTRRAPVPVVLCTANDPSEVWRAALAAR